MIKINYRALASLIETVVGSPWLLLGLAAAPLVWIIIPYYKEIFTVFVAIGSLAAVIIGLAFSLATFLSVLDNSYEYIKDEEWVYIVLYISTAVLNILFGFTKFTNQEFFIIGSVMFLLVLTAAKNAGSRYLKAKKKAESRRKHFDYDDR